MKKKAKTKKLNTKKAATKTTARRTTNWLGSMKASPNWKTEMTKDTGTNKWGVVFWLSNSKTAAKKRANQLLTALNRGV